MPPSRLILYTRCFFIRHLPFGNDWQKNQDIIGILSLGTFGFKHHILLQQHLTSINTSLWRNLEDKQFHRGTFQCMWTNSFVVQQSPVLSVLGNDAASHLVKMSDEEVHTSLVTRINHYPPLCTAGFSSFFSLVLPLEIHSSFSVLPMSKKKAHVARREKNRVIHAIRRLGSSLGMNQVK